MAVVFLAITTAICAVGWISQKIGVMTLLWYIQEKGCPLPSDADLEKGNRFVIEHILKDLRRK